MNDMAPMLKTEVETGEERRAAERPRRGWARLLSGLGVLALLASGLALRRVALPAATARRDGGNPSSA